MAKKSNVLDELRTNLKTVTLDAVKSTSLEKTDMSQARQTIGAAFETMMTSASVAVADMDEEDAGKFKSDLRTEVTNFARRMQSIAEAASQELQALSSKI